jgi:hypothetical protein
MDAAMHGQGSAIMESSCLFQRFEVGGGVNNPGVSGGEGISMLVAYSLQFIVL